jgi:hypothetical protein
VKWYHEGLQNLCRGFDSLSPCQKYDPKRVIFLYIELPEQTALLGRESNAPPPLSLWRVNSAFVTALVRLWRKALARPSRRKTARGAADSPSPCSNNHPCGWLFGIYRAFFRIKSPRRVVHFFAHQGKKVYSVFGLIKKSLPAHSGTHLMFGRRV